MFMESYFETKKFLRRFGEEIFDKLENEDVYALCLDNLKALNKPPLSNEIIEDILTIVTTEESSKQDSEVLDEFTPEEHSAYLAKKCRQTPCQIFRENLKHLDGKRSVHDDDDRIYGMCNSYIPLEEDITEDLIEDFFKASINPLQDLNGSHNIERFASQLGTNLPVLRSDEVDSIMNHMGVQHYGVFGSNA